MQTSEMCPEICIGSVDDQVADLPIYSWDDDYQQARSLAQAGRPDEARELLQKLAPDAPDMWLRALVRNDLGTLAAMRSDWHGARAELESALAFDPDCLTAQANLVLLDAACPNREVPATSNQDRRNHSETSCPRSLGKIAILSFLFNWPSTGGGNIHTVELTSFLQKAGFDIQHFFVRYEPWGIGQDHGSLPFASRALEFADATWKLADIKARYRQAVDDFGPDHVIITDAWSMKPHLAEAMRGYATILRFQALECLCPLNNVRLLAESNGRFSQCGKNQLAHPKDCLRCLGERGAFSGGLHQAERELSGVGSAEYVQTLRLALREAEAVLVLNPTTEALLSPFARRVEVVPWGMDPARFPRLVHKIQAGGNGKKRKTIFQAGIVTELMKGFHVLHAACAELWKKRQDFELVATGDPAGQVDEMLRFTGWVSQEDLPTFYQNADIVVVPTIAQEGLNRTSVEAMAAGKPVVASRIGGLPFTVADGVTGFLVEPDNVGELAKKLNRLLDDAPLREQMGAAGRRRFEEHFSWDVVVERYYRPLLQKAAR